MPTALDQLENRTERAGEETALGENIVDISLDQSAARLDRLESPIDLP